MASHDFFVMIKPDGVRRGLVGEILSRFEKRNFGVKAMKMLQPSDDTTRFIEKHYESHAGMHYYEDTIKFMTTGPIVILKLYGSIQVARSIVGPTVPWEAFPGSVRGDYTCSFPENLIHCSHSPGDATKELGVWSVKLD